MANNKKEEIKGEERLENVESALSKTELWIEEHQKLIYGIIAAVIIIAGIIWGLKALNDRKRCQGQQRDFYRSEIFRKGIIRGRPSLETATILASLRSMINSATPRLVNSQLTMLVSAT
jgi:hypothetical protein